MALATRDDPALGLHRLRLTDRLTEIRAGDLRFSIDESRRLLEADGIALADEAVALLHERDRLSPCWGRRSSVANG